jgi:hypothetical protein
VQYLGDANVLASPILQPNLVFAITQLGSVGRRH